MFDALRAMSYENLMFSYLMQQLRKRHLNLIYTVQSEMWGDDRLRWQTSLFIKCSDAAYFGGMPKPGELGRKSRWTIYDLSGVIRGDTGSFYDRSKDPLTAATVFKGDFHNTPFWHSYDTEQLQVGHDYESPDTGGDISIKDTESLATLKEKYAEAQAVIDQVMEYDLGEVPCSNIWQILGIENDRSLQTKVGSQLQQLGVTKFYGPGNKNYYRFPPKSGFSNNGDK